MASLEAGFSHDIFVEWAADGKNLVLFTERGQVSSLERRTLIIFVKFFEFQLIWKHLIHDQYRFILSMTKGFKLFFMFNLWSGIILFFILVKFIFFLCIKFIVSICKNCLPSM